MGVGSPHDRTQRHPGVTDAELEADIAQILSDDLAHSATALAAATGQPVERIRERLAAMAGSKRVWESTAGPDRWLRIVYPEPEESWKKRVNIEATRHGLFPEGARALR
jgi:hypothetical protein